MKFSILLLTLLIFSLTAGNIKAQNNGIGGFIGGGYIGGESPNIGSLNLSLFVDIDPGISDVFYPRFTFFYAGDFEKILPGTRTNYFSYMKGFSLKGIITQDYEDNYFLEEGLGFIYLNDRTFAYTNSWSPGVVFSLAAGMDFTPFRLAVGAEYGFTFGGTFPKYFSLHFQAKYIL